MPVLFVFLLLSGCSNNAMNVVGRSLSSAGTADTSQINHVDTNAYKINTVSQNGTVVGHEQNGRILYNDGSSAQIR